MNQIKTHSANGRNYLIVQVPKETKEHNVDDDALIFVWVPTGTPDYIDLPPGQYTLLFIAEEATEEQAEQIVQKEMYEAFVEDMGLLDFVHFKDYEYDCFELSSSIQSSQSLIRSLFPNSTDYKYVILERHD